MSKPCAHLQIYLFMACLILGVLSVSGKGSTPESAFEQRPSELASLTTEPNPYLSFLPTGARPNERYWEQQRRQGAARRRLDLPTPPSKAVIPEAEPNDTRATANFIAVFGTAVGEDPVADVTGGFTAPAAPTVIGPFAEDEGSILLASETGLNAGSAVFAAGTIGDGPFGSGGTSSGDFDFFRIPGVTTGQLIVIDIDTPGNLDTFVVLYDSAGNIMALNEDEDGSNTDSFLAVSAAIDDDYYLSIGGSIFPFVSALTDPFDSSSGSGSGSEGDYEVTISLEHGDPDWFSFELDPCDILGVNLTGAGHQVMVTDPGGVLTVASATDLSFAYPAASTLPGGGVATLAYIASEPGTYAVRVLGTSGSDYTLELRLFRQALEASRTPKTLFVDFDGAVVDPVIFGGTPGNTSLSPLSSFLSDWGLTPGDEDAVIDGILATLEENLTADPGQTLYSTSGVELLNSRDHADPFGMPGVSRLIVGGTIPELGLPTIGIAQSIDPGNFELGETAVILLDLLSRPPPEPDSLNTFPLAPGVSIIELIGVAVGNIAAHEAGHYVGNFHTEQFNPAANIMDRGGNLPNTIGVGPDGIFGNTDDVDVDFGGDMFADSEGFAGVEDTGAVVVCGCAISPELFSDSFESGDLNQWSSSTP